MARSTNVYLAMSKTGDALATCTVKYEMEDWLTRSGAQPETVDVFRMPDGGGRGKKIVWKRTSLGVECGR